MPLLMTDEELASAGLTESDAKLEIACRLFDAGKISFPAASRLAGVTRTEMEAALIACGLPIVRLTLEGLESELGAFVARQHR